MALIADRDIVLRYRTVACVAVLTGNGLVARAFVIYLRGLRGMTLNAIAGVERRLGSPVVAA
jgi:hypothetical protein